MCGLLFAFSSFAQGQKKDLPDDGPEPDFPTYSFKTKIDAAALDPESGELAILQKSSNRVSILKPAFFSGEADAKIGPVELGKGLRALCFMLFIEFW